MLFDALIAIWFLADAPTVSVSAWRSHARAAEG
jgi:hypothetical protein